MRSQTHDSWHDLLEAALSSMDTAYLEALLETSTWLPGIEKFLSAFSLPREKVSYILFGESPYPRQESANGYAFWDASIDVLWSMQGLAKKTNRATSLRNIVKMLLVASGDLSIHDTSQAAIARLNKEHYVQTLDALCHKLQNHGFLLLNASLVYRENKVRYDAKAWLPFIESVLFQLKSYKNQVHLILLGKIAQTIMTLAAAQDYDYCVAEHPYNLSFISNPKVLAFCRPLHLLKQ